MFLDRIIPFTMPTKIIHGSGSVKAIPEECRRLGVKKVLVVTDEGLVRAGVIKDITDILAGAQIPYTSTTEWRIDPSMNTVHEGEKLRRSEGCDGISSWAAEVLCARGRPLACSLRTAEGSPTIRGWERSRRPPCP